YRGARASPRRGPSALRGALHGDPDGQELSWHLSRIAPKAYKRGGAAESGTATTATQRRNGLRAHVEPELAGPRGGGGDSRGLVLHSGDRSGQQAAAHA